MSQLSTGYRELCGTERGMDTVHELEGGWHRPKTGAKGKSSPQSDYTENDLNASFYLCMLKYSKHLYLIMGSEISFNSENYNYSQLKSLVQIK